MANVKKSNMKSILRYRSKATKSRPIKNNTGFDQKNVEATSHMPIGGREYGFIRAANNTATPFPLAQKTLNTPSLLTHLRLAQAKINAARKRPKGSQMQLSSSGSSISFITKLGKESCRSNNILETKQPSLSTPEMSFNLKRKLFDEAEFTITRGQKLSDLHHRINVPEDAAAAGVKRDTQMFSLNEMEAFCRRMNIKINKGFDPSSN